MTLKSWGGVPREISEKSGLSAAAACASGGRCDLVVLTLGVQEVANGHWMRSIGNVRRLEDLLDVRLGLDAHVLLTEGLCLLLEAGVLLRMVSWSSVGGCANGDSCDEALTSCSESGIFFSFILWTPAAEPVASREPAASRIAVFMTIATSGVPGTNEMNDGRRQTAGGLGVAMEWVSVWGGWRAPDLLGSWDGEVVTTGVAACCGAKAARERYHGGFRASRAACREQLVAQAPCCTRLVHVNRGIACFIPISPRRRRLLLLGFCPHR